LSKLRGGSPRIHAGELGFQAERFAQDYYPPVLAAGFSRPGLKPERYTGDSFRDAEASLPLLKQGAPIDTKYKLLLGRRPEVGFRFHKGFRWVAHLRVDEE
jgi:hypothetical protein